MDISPTRYAPHLSEFYLMFNSQNDQGLSQQKQQDGSIGVQNQRVDMKIKKGGVEAVLEGNDKGEWSKRTIKLSENGDRYSHFKRPSSIRSSSRSVRDLETLVTKKDMVQTHELMNNLVNEVNGYASSLTENANQASNVAFALENVVHLKGCTDESANKFLSVSGVFHLLSNHDRIIANLVSETLVPSLRERIKEFSSTYKSSEVTFKKNFKDETIKLKRQESYNIKLSRHKNRNLFSYRENLMNMQQLLDSIEILKHNYYQDSYNLIKFSCQEVLHDMATLTRAQVEISENLARKGWSGGGLEDLIVNAQDPFSKDKTDDEAEAEYPLSSNDIKDSIRTTGTVEEADTAACAGSEESDKNFSGEGKTVEDTGFTLAAETAEQVFDHQTSVSARSTGNITITHSSLKNTKPNVTDSIPLQTSSKSIQVDYSFSLPLAGSKGYLQDDRNSKKKQPEVADILNEFKEIPSEISKLSIEKSES